jgi:predicted enzyme related to lactoylglutathione lyase
MFKKIAFTMFPVDDTTRARAFYEGTLGLKRGSSAANGVWTEYDLPGGGCLALFNHPDPSAKGQRGTTGASIAFEVEDLDRVMTDLRTRGVKFTSGVIESPVCRMANLVDSEGNAIILHELHRK